MEELDIPPTGGRNGLETLYHQKLGGNRTAFENANTVEVGTSMKRVLEDVLHVFKTMAMLPTWPICMMILQITSGLTGKHHRMEDGGTGAELKRKWTHCRKTRKSFIP